MRRQAHQESCDVPTFPPRSDFWFKLPFIPLVHEAEFRVQVLPSTKALSQEGFVRGLQDHVNHEFGSRVHRSVVHSGATGRCAPMRSAMKRCVLGLIMRSSSASKNQDGFRFPCWRRSRFLNTLNCDWPLHGSRNACLIGEALWATARRNPSSGIHMKPCESGTSFGASGCGWITIEDFCYRLAFIGRERRDIYQRLDSLFSVPLRSPPLNRRVPLGPRDRWFVPVHDSKRQCRRSMRSTESARR